VHDAPELRELLERREVSWTYFDAQLTTARSVVSDEGEEGQKSS
jgi:hypothetical protein